MDICYLCGDEFNSQNVKKHNEHIIQQAIGGSLTEKDILCLSCGNNLGEKIDVPFNKIFSGISTHLDIKKDRKTNKKNIVKGTFISKYDQFGNELGKIDVLWKDFKVTPIQPFHKYTKDSKQVIIYAAKNISKSYKNKVESEILKKFDEGKRPEIIICDDIEGEICYPFNMDNKIFKQGLAKIAIGFASKHGISRTNLPLVLDTNEKNGAIKNDIAVVQFYPLGTIDYEIEQEKNKFGYYPTHTLIIFTTKTKPKVLVCYIELFSTFQMYVILNSDYTENSIYKYYSQRVSKEDNYNFEPDRRYYKERNFILGDLGITEKRITNAYNNQVNENQEKKSREQIEYEVIQEEHIKQKYSIDFEAEIESSVNFVVNKKIAEKDIDSMLDLKRNLDLFYYRKLKNDDEYGINEDEYEEIFNILSYRNYFIRDNEIHDYLSTLIVMRDILIKPEEFKKYGHTKMEMLRKFTEIEGIKKK
ncbi:MAG: hypothetical protein KAU26_01295 [Methylococcales bacterium]|nr:hypothetical protein [Methylococcales bacterium]